MAGLSVLLEPQNPFPKCPQIINKTNIFTKQSPPSLSSHYAPFLRYCFLCHQSLKEGKDIYMYSGDKAFCSEECRCRQIFMDEESGRRDGCSLAVARRSRKSRPVGGGFA